MRNVKIEQRKKSDRNMKKNILVVDDSALMRRAICDIVNSSDEYEATDTCRDGLEAYEKIKKGKYAAVLLDINMPRMNGLELLQKLQKENIRVTVIVVSSLAKEDADITVKALEYGAVDFLTKPENIIEAKGGRFRASMVNILNAVLEPRRARVAAISAATAVSAATAASAAVAARKITSAISSPTASAAKTMPRKAAPASSGTKKLVALACSTGGPKALQSVIPYLDKNMDAPMVLVQHMPTGFTKSMAERLNELSKVEVKEAEENDVLKKGCVYVAPGGYHLEVVAQKDGNHKIHLSDAPAIGGLRPCANVMYKSLRRSTYDHITCVVLTGMGADGTEGIRELNKAKSIYVIAQDEASCVVYGMPKSIAEAGLTDEVATLTDIPKRIINHVGVK